MSTRRPVLEVANYKTYFEPHAAQEVFILSKEEAREIWKRNISTEVNALHKLEGKNWKYHFGRKFLAEWMPDFNKESRERINILLHNQVEWKDTDEVFYCLHSENILCTNWKYFRENWISFIHLSDEFSIVLNPGKNEYALMVEPSGYLVKVLSAP